MPEEDLHLSEQVRLWAHGAPASLPAFFVSFGEPEPNPRELARATIIAALIGLPGTVAAPPEKDWHQLA